MQPWAAVIALIAIAQSAETSTPSRSLDAVLGDRPFSVIADRLSAAPRRGVFIAEGNVVVRRPGLIVRADRVTFDDQRRVAHAEGHVAIVEGQSVLFCARVELAMPEMIGGVKSAELRIKERLPEEVAGALDASQLREYGKDELILTAREVDRTGARTSEIEGGSFTACDCGEGEAPTWSIDASSASVDLDSGAWLSWPVFYAKGVPVLALPTFYVPLGDRRTGLLAPRVGHSRVTGFRASQPLFITLGESWDTTIEAGFLFDRGPSAALELRWAPSETSRGVARVASMLDYGVPDGAGGWTRDRDDPLARFSISARHASRLGEETKLAAELNLAGDPAYVAELADAFLARQIESTTSRVTITSGSKVRVAGGIAFIEDLRPQTYMGDLRAVQIFSDDENGAGQVRQRFAELRIDAPLYPLLAEESPIFGEARLALHAFSAPRSDVARFVRADLRPAISLPLSLFELAVLEQELAVRLTAWGGRAEHADQSATRFALIAKSALFTELGRRYGDYVHRIRPSIEYTIIPYVERRGGGAAVFANGDEIDLLRPIMQARARIVTDLLRAGGHRTAGFEAWIGRDLGLPGEADGAGTSELVMRAGFELPFGISVDGRSAFAIGDSTAVTELIAGAAIARGPNALAVHFGTFDARAPEHSFIAAEELVPSRTIDRSALAWRPFKGLAVNLQLAEDLPGEWGRVTLSSVVHFVFDRAEDRPPVTYGPDVLRNTETLLRWDSSCDCLGVGAVIATARDRPGIDLAGVVIDLARLGQVSARPSEL